MEVGFEGGLIEGSDKEALGVAEKGQTAYHASHLPSGDGQLLA